MLDRWGTLTFADVLAPAIEIAERGFPMSERLSRLIATSQKLRQYPTSMKVYCPGGHCPAPGEIWKNPDLARTRRPERTGRSAGQIPGVVKSSW